MSKRGYGVAGVVAAKIQKVLRVFPSNLRLRLSPLVVPVIDVHKAFQKMLIQRDTVSVTANGVYDTWTVPEGYRFWLTGINLVQASGTYDVDHVTVEYGSLVTDLFYLKGHVGGADLGNFELNGLYHLCASGAQFHFHAANYSATGNCIVTLIGILEEVA